jgi:methyl-accepting chemotaxis protein
VLTNLTIGRRLALGFGLLLALMLGAAVVAISGFRSARALADKVQDQTTKIVLARDLEDTIHGIVMDVGVIVAAEDPGTRKEYLARIEGARPEYQRMFAELLATARTQEAKDLTRETAAATAALKAQDDAALALAAAGRGPEARRVYATAVQPALRHLDQVFDSLNAWRTRRMQGSVLDIRSTIDAMVAFLAVATVVALALAGLMAVLLTRGITGPLRIAMDHLGDMARGDVRRDLPEEQLARRDEIGAMARALQETLQSLRKAFGAVAEGSRMIASSSTELSALSAQMADGTRDTAHKATAVAAAAEEMGMNESSVAAGMEQASASLRGVSDATTQMTATVAEIAASSEKARVVTDQANRQALGLGALMTELDRSAREIGKVTETITGISSQTNLLALNATIEAARAGAAGKGFAVVANEIKELAQQTATATLDIKGRIQAIQDATASSTEDIRKVGGIIREVSDLVASIATAIEEQATVTKDIAGNLAEAVAGIQDANDRVNQSSAVAQSIAREISGVDRSAREISDGVEQVKASAGDLSRLAERMHETVQQFRL